MAGQFLRFGLVGIVITLLSAISYWLLATRGGVQPNLALLLVFAVFSVVGYVSHGRFSFAAGSPASGRGAGQYLLVNGCALALNQAWIWLLVDHRGLPVWTPVIPMVLITPVATFLMLRQWVYRTAAKAGPHSSEQNG